MFKNALISVSDKNHLVPFVQFFSERGMRVVSSGGTARHLAENGIDVVPVSEQTGFPEVLDGRVKTLHPKIHMGLLARSFVEEDQKTLASHQMQAFDLVVVNLYPFEKAYNEGVRGQDLIEMIDIGGPSMLRAAAKNFQDIAVVCDPSDYEWILEKQGELTLEDRRRLAGKVFSLTATLDSMISQSLIERSDTPFWGIGAELKSKLRYGENPQQEAYWYSSKPDSKGLHAAEILQGKELSYNNLLDLDAASRAVQEFDEPAVVAVKHTNPCGICRSDSVSGAVQGALAADPVSVFGGIVAVNRPIDAAAAGALNALFLECIVAPDFQPDALKILSKKKNLRLLKWPGLPDRDGRVLVRSVLGGYLVQNPDTVELESENWEFIGEKPTSEMRAHLAFAWKACAHLKSNAIAITTATQTVGLGMGQVNRVDAVHQAIERYRLHHPNVQDVVLASDAFFPFPDSIELIHKAGIRWVIQPGGSVRDDEVRAKAQECNINMVLTGRRHFRH